MCTATKETNTAAALAIDKELGPEVLRYGTDPKT